ncbi:hypothetical protein [Paractinoplanes ferrugineus]|uniref:hypothetical protein n=1 Tax=Paractinoplanes ferrugineus TaxID=113564 RepID=UPI001943886B|nr:hypothetical protein [Actinoplanes ferrugineus]
MAVALVLGQALLCALVGYLTLGRSGAQPRADQLAEPPLAPPVTATRSFEPPSSAAPSSRAATATGKPKRRNTAGSGRSRTAPPPAPPGLATRSPMTLLGPSPSARPPGPTPGSGNPFLPPRPPTVPPGGPVQRPVTVGDLCVPAGAFGFTSDDTLVRCLRTARHAPRWKIV